MIAEEKPRVRVFQGDLLKDVERQVEAWIKKAPLLLDANGWPCVRLSWSICEYGGKLIYLCAALAMEHRNETSL